MHTLSAYVCTHVVLAFDVCLFGALGQVNFPPSLMNAFSSSCSCKRNSSPSLSVSSESSSCFDVRKCKVKVFLKGINEH